MVAFLHALRMRFVFITEEDRLRARSHTPEETEQETKARRKREKALKKANGGKLTHVRASVKMCTRGTADWIDTVSEKSDRSREASSRVGQYLGLARIRYGYHQAYSSSAALGHRYETAAFPA